MNLEETYFKGRTYAEIVAEWEKEAAEAKEAAVIIRFRASLLVAQAGGLEATAAHIKECLARVKELAAQPDPFPVLGSANA